MREGKTAGVQTRFQVYITRVAWGRDASGAVLGYFSDLSKRMRCSRVTYCNDWRNTAETPIVHARYRSGCVDSHRACAVHAAFRNQAGKPAFAFRESQMDNPSQPDETASVPQGGSLREHLKSLLRKALAKDERRQSDKSQDSLHPVANAQGGDIKDGDDTP